MKKKMEGEQKSAEHCILEMIDGIILETLINTYNIVINIYN
jgi:hypothetical protein